MDCRRPRDPRCFVRGVVTKERVRRLGGLRVCEGTGEQITPHTVAHRSMSSEEVERLKSELAAVKGRAVSKIKQQAQQISEQQTQIAELKAQLAERDSDSKTPSNSSEDGDKERFVKVTRTEGLGDQEKEDDLRRREEALLAREQALADHPDAGGGPSRKAAPAWHAALLDGLQTIQQNLLL